MFLQIRRAYETVAARVDARWIKAGTLALRWGVPLVLLGVVGYSLTQLGWGQIWKARPAGLAFYLVLMLPFFVQPVADLVIYRYLLGVGRKLPFSILLRKRYMNSVMLDYSGEIYFFFWARKNLGLEHGTVLHAVKDSNVLSAGAGLTTVLLMLLALAATGAVKMPTFVPAHIWTIVAVGSLPAVLCLGLLVGGRKVTRLSRTDMAATFGIHILRSITALGLEFLLWWLSGVLPSLTMCLEFVALRLLVTRLPLVPNKDLVFVGVGIAAAGFMDASAPGVAAVLVLMTAMNLLQEFVLVGLPWLVEQFAVRRIAGQIAS
jgi:hypothetical protein